MTAPPALDVPYYGSDLAWVHHDGFGSHADACAPGILRILEPVRQRQGLVVELGCGSGRLTRHLIDAGHRVIASDASPAMLELARGHAPEAEVRLIALPDDPIPEADAIVSVGHALSYLRDESAIERSFRAIAASLRPNGILAFDICDLEWGTARRVAPPYVRLTDDWAIVVFFSQPSENRFVRDITVFRRAESTSWRRSDERHENVLVNTERIPSLLAESGIEATVTTSFGTEQLPAGLRAVSGQRVAR